MMTSINIKSAKSDKFKHQNCSRHENKNINSDTFIDYCFQEKTFCYQMLTNNVQKINQIQLFHFRNRKCNHQNFQNLLSPNFLIFYPLS